MDEIIPDIWDVTAGVALIIAGVSLWFVGGSRRIWGGEHGSARQSRAPE